MRATNSTSPSDLFFIVHPFLHELGYILQFMKDIPSYARTTFSLVLPVFPVLVLVRLLLALQVLVPLRQALPLPLVAEEFPGCSPSMKHLQKM